MSRSQCTCKPACTQENISAIQKYLVSGEIQSVIYKSGAVKTLKCFFSVQFSKCACWLLFVSAQPCSFWSLYMALTLAQPFSPKCRRCQTLVQCLKVCRGHLRKVSLDSSLAFCSSFLIIFFFYDDWVQFFLQPRLARNCMTNTGKLRHQVFFTSCIHKILLKRPRAIIYWRGKRVKSAHEARDPLGRSLSPLL